MQAEDIEAELLREQEMLNRQQDAGLSFSKEFGTLLDKKTGKLPPLAWKKIKNLNPEGTLVPHTKPPVNIKAGKTQFNYQQQKRPILDMPFEIQTELITNDKFAQILPDLKVQATVLPTSDAEVRASDLIPLIKILKQWDATKQQWIYKPDYLKLFDTLTTNQKLDLLNMYKRMQYVERKQEQQIDVQHWQKTLDDANLIKKVRGNKWIQRQYQYYTWCKQQEALLLDSIPSLRYYFNGSGVAPTTQLSAPIFIDGTYSQLLQLQANPVQPKHSFFISLENLVPKAVSDVQRLDLLKNIIKTNQFNYFPQAIEVEVKGGTSGMATLVVYAQVEAMFFQVYRSKTKQFQKGKTLKFQWHDTNYIIRFRSLIKHFFQGNFYQLFDADNALGSLKTFQQQFGDSSIQLDFRQPDFTQVNVKYPLPANTTAMLNWYIHCENIEASNVLTIPSGRVELKYWTNIETMKGILPIDAIGIMIRWILLKISRLQTLEAVHAFENKLVQEGLRKLKGNQSGILKKLQYLFDGKPNNDYKIFLQS